MMKKFYVAVLSLVFCLFCFEVKPQATLTVAAVVANASCYQFNDGSIIATAGGGVPPYTYFWTHNSTNWSHITPGPSFQTALVAGLYDLTVTDSDVIPKQVSASWNVLEPDEIVITATMVPSSCPPTGPGNDGCIAVQVTGGVPPYIYAWSNAATTQNICGLACTPSTYYLTVKDANNCVKSGTWVYADVQISATITDAGGNCFGAISLAVSCASPLITYSWISPSYPAFSQTTQNISGLRMGWYCVAVTDGPISKSCCFWVGAKKSACESNYLQDLMVGAGEDNCYDALEDIYVAGNGLTFTVQNGGTATLIAGEKISFLPGTKVNLGGKLHGYITSNGVYCNNKNSNEGAGTEGTGNDTVSGQEISGNQLFKLFPNPTAGNFLLELTGNSLDPKANVEIYSSRGEKFLSAEIHGKSSHEFSLSDRPAGLYFIRVVTEKNAGMGKIIKQ